MKLLLEYAGAGKLSLGQELILNPATGEMRPRLWGRKPIRRVTIATVVAIGVDSVVIELHPPMLRTV